MTPEKGSDYIVNKIKRNSTKIVLFDVRNQRNYIN